MTGFRKKVYQVTKKIPKGKVSTYGMIACLIGNCKASRAVGNALNKNYHQDVPCHRVIKSDGQVGGYRGGPKQKIRKLREEGVKMKNNKIDLKKFGLSNFFNRVAFCYNIIPYLLRINYPLAEKEMILKKDEKILDVGGGTGRLAKRIIDLFGAEVTILDPSEPMLKRVKHHSQIKTIRGNIEKNSFKDKSFNTVICVDTIHHLENPEVAFQEMYRLLKPEGRIFIQDFDVTKFRTKILRFVEKHFLDEPGRFYSPQTLVKMLKEVGFNGSFKPILAIQYLYIGKKT